MRGEEAVGGEEMNAIWRYGRIMSLWAAVLPAAVICWFIAAMCLRLLAVLSTWAVADLNSPLGFIALAWTCIICDGWSGAVFVFCGAWIAPTSRGYTAVALAVLMAGCCVAWAFHDPRALSIASSAFTAAGGIIMSAQLALDKQLLPDRSFV